MSRSGYRNGPSTTLYVRGIPDRIRHEDLKRVFTKYGKVIDITIPLDYYSGMSKGYCFVEYDDIRDSEEAQYRLDRSRTFGKEIDVEFSRGQRKTPGEMRNRDRDRRYRSPVSSRDYGGRRSRTRSRSRSAGRDRREAKPRRRSPSREGSYRRSKSRHSRSRSASPRPHEHASRDRSGSRRSPKINEHMSRSRSVSPA